MDFIPEIGLVYKLFTASLFKALMCLSLVLQGFGQIIRVWGMQVLYFLLLEMKKIRH